MNGSAEPSKQIYRPTYEKTNPTTVQGSPRDNESPIVSEDEDGLSINLKTPGLPRKAARGRRMDPLLLEQKRPYSLLSLFCVDPITNRLSIAGIKILKYLVGGPPAPGPIKDTFALAMTCRSLKWPIMTHYRLESL